MVVSPDVTYSVVRVQGLKAARPRWRITPPTWPRIWARAMLCWCRSPPAMPCEGMSSKGC